MGDHRGNVAVYGFPGGNSLFARNFAGPISAVRFSKGGQILVAAGRSLQLVEPQAGGASIPLTHAKGRPVSGEFRRSSFSGDGRWLAACSEDGNSFVWSLADPRKPIPVALPEDSAGGKSFDWTLSADPKKSRDKARPLATSPAFTTDGRTLILGDSDGGIRAFNLGLGADAPDVEARPRIQAARGKVASLSPSPTGRYLLEITKDDLALVWDLKEGRGCKLLPGRWISGAFLPDESMLALAVRPDENGNGGDVVLFDRSGDKVLPLKFLRPNNPDGRPSLAAFGSIVVSKTGRWVAAASLEQQRPVACVWETGTGKLRHTVRDHDDGLTSLDLSGDETVLLTASAEGAAKVWPMDDPSTGLHKPLATFLNPEGKAPAITSARICAGQAGKVILGTREGFAFYWQWRKPRPNVVELEPLKGEDFAGEVNATVFSADGRWMAASWSLSKSIRFWSIPDAGPPAIVRFGPTPNHSEQVGGAGRLARRLDDRQRGRRHERPVLGPQDPLADRDPRRPGEGRPVRRLARLHARRPLRRLPARRGDGQVAGRLENRDAPAVAGHPPRLSARRRLRPGRQAPGPRAQGRRPAAQDRHAVFRPVHPQSAGRPLDLVGRHQAGGTPPLSERGPGPRQGRFPARSEPELPGDDRRRAPQGGEQVLRHGLERRGHRRPVRRADPPLRRPRRARERPHPGPRHQRLQESAPEICPRGRPEHRRVPQVAGGRGPPGTADRPDQRTCEQG